jgi:DNA mismatch endonuclease (patch repair protein)
MTDTFTPEMRSSIMRSVKARATGPEMKVRRLVWNLGFRYRLHAKDLPGKPDLVFRGRRKVIFVHGCFWHGHDCKRGSRVPVANSEYWRAKVAGNAARDAESCRRLQEAGWESLVIWECQLRDMEALSTKIKRFLK